MKDSRSDALVFFGATGDLAYKKIFPALYAMARRGRLDFPVIGVARSGWTLEQLQARARESVEKHGDAVDEATFAELAHQLRFVDGDYRDPATYVAIRKELDTARRPAHYLAIPPSMFAIVVEGLGQSGCARDARVILEKPFGRDLPSAQVLNGTLHTIFEALRTELGYADYLGALQRYRLERPRDPSVLCVSSFLVNYAFADRLFPASFESVRHLARWGPTVILSDGDAVFQPRKIERSGLFDLVERRVLIYIHKEQQLDDVAQRLTSIPGVVALALVAAFDEDEETA